jgi:hypothetical protein
MGQSDFLDWLDEDYGDRRVQRRLESELQDAYSYQAQESSALRSQMEQVQGSLEQRIDRLSKAFYAFVELSDLRAELAVFEDEATVRHAALRLLRSLLRRAADAGTEPPALPADLPRCPGYWLRPAVGSVAGSIAGDERAAAAALAEAQELDPVRTAVFRAAALALAGHPALASPLLSAALMEPGEQVTYGQRALWNACARGVFGDEGTGVIREWLAGYVRGLDTAAASAEGAQWASQATQALTVSGLPGQLRQGLPHALSVRDELVNPLVAARELSALAAWVREAASGEPAGPAAASAAGPDPVAVLGAVAAALTGEGSREEIALERRARELREIIDDRKRSTRPSWDATENSMLSLLRADAFGADLPLRRLAIGAGTAWIAALADDLARSASVPPPDRLEVALDRHTVQVDASGQVSLKAAYAEIEQQNAPQDMAGKLFGKKRAAEETSWEQERLAGSANEAATAFAARVAELRAAVQQAPADREDITVSLGRR